MIRFIMGLVLLAVAAVLLGYAGGIDVLSVGGWRGAASTWALPAKDDNERCIALLIGGMFVFMSLLRFLRSSAARPMMPPKVEA